MRWIALVMVLGCRGPLPEFGSDPSVPDAFTPEPDAADVTVPCEVTGPPGLVTLHGFGMGLIHDEQGAVLSQVTSDAQGDATAMIPPCGAVTFIIESNRYFTVTHVSPGETIDLGLPFRTDGVRPVEVSFPLFPGATSYAVRPAARAGSGCSAFGSAVSPIGIDFNAACIADDQTISFAVEARDANGLVAYAIVSRAALASSGTTSIAITDWRTDSVAVSGAITNLPDPTWEPRVQFMPLTDGMYGPTTAFGMFQSQLAVTGPMVLASATMTNPHGHESGIDLLLRSVPVANAQNLVIDGTADFAPHVATVTRDDSDPARPRITWTTTTPATDIQAIAITADWDGFQWFVVAPPNQPGAIRFPDLPAALRPTLPPQTGPGALAVMTARSSAYATAADVRAKPLSLWYPTFFFPPVDDFTWSTSALGDYDQP